MHELWIKVGARHSPLLVSSENIDLMRKGVPIGSIHWAAKSYIFIRYDTPLVYYFMPVEDLDDTNFESLIASSNTLVESGLDEAEKDIEKGLSTKPGKSKEDIETIFAIYSRSFGLMMAGYYLAQIALKVLERHVGEDFQNIQE